MNNPTLACRDIILCSLPLAFSRSPLSTDLDSLTFVFLSPLSLSLYLKKYFVQSPYISTKLKFMASVILLSRRGFFITLLAITSSRFKTRAYSWCLCTIISLTLCSESEKCLWVGVSIWIHLSKNCNYKLRRNYFKSLISLCKSDIWDIYLFSTSFSWALNVRKWESNSCLIFWYFLRYSFFAL